MYNHSKKEKIKSIPLTSFEKKKEKSRMEKPMIWETAKCSRKDILVVFKA